MRKHLKEAIKAQAKGQDADARTNEGYIKAARKLYQQDGEVEIDQNCAISYSTDGGAYVAAWVWVSDLDVTFPRKRKAVSR